MKFVVIKTLPIGIYHYHFVVDGWLAYAPDLPWFRDDSGNAYNILDLQVSFMASRMPLLLLHIILTELCFPGTYF